MELIDSWYLLRHFWQTQVFRTASSGICVSSSSWKTADSHQHSVALGSAARAHWLGSPQRGQVEVSRLFFACLEKKPFASHKFPHPLSESTKYSPQTRWTGIRHPMIYDIVVGKLIRFACHQVCDDTTKCLSRWNTFAQANTVINI